MALAPGEGRFDRRCLEAKPRVAPVATARVDRDGFMGAPILRWHGRTAQAVRTITGPGMVGAETRKPRRRRPGKASSAGRAAGVHS